MLHYTVLYEELLLAVPPPPPPLLVWRRARLPDTREAAGKEGRKGEGEGVTGETGWRRLTKPNSSLLSGHADWAVCKTNKGREWRETITWRGEHLRTTNRQQQDAPAPEEEGKTRTRNRHERRIFFYSHRAIHFLATLLPSSTLVLSPRVILPFFLLIFFIYVQNLRQTNKHKNDKNNVGGQRSNLVTINLQPHWIRVSCIQSIKVVLRIHRLL